MPEYNYTNFHLLKSSNFSKISYLSSEIAQGVISSPDSLPFDWDFATWSDQTGGIWEGYAKPRLLCPFCLTNWVPWFLYFLFPAWLSLLWASRKLCLTTNSHSGSFSHCFWLNLWRRQGKERSSSAFCQGLPFPLSLLMVKKTCLNLVLLQEGHLLQSKTSELTANSWEAKITKGDWISVHVVDIFIECLRNAMPCFLNLGDLKT